jgi:enamine deaminase RidA (YjgF/YER057c/UK114 family)
MALIEKKLQELGVELKKAESKNPWIIGCKQTGNLVFLSGHGPENSQGKLGREFNTEQGAAIARQVMIQLLATLKTFLGDLDRVTSIVKVLGMVNSMPDFIEQPAVINGASRLLVEAFGPECGKHARSAVGMASLPGGIPIEIEMIVEVA